MAKRMRKNAPALKAKAPATKPAKSQDPKPATGAKAKPEAPTREKPLVTGRGDGKAKDGAAPRESTLADRIKAVKRTGDEVARPNRFARVLALVPTGGIERGALYEAVAKDTSFRFAEPVPVAVRNTIRKLVEWGYVEVIPTPKPAAEK